MTIAVVQEEDGWAVYRGDYRVVTFKSKQAAEDLARLMRWQENDR